MKNDLRAHGILATLFATSLGAFAFGCAAPDTADDVDEDADEPALHDQAMAVCDPAYSVCGGGGDVPPSEPR